jgi:catechol 2,3-dioxygenase-like lactoylglutathione lyase family enzyme
MEEKMVKGLAHICFTVSDLDKSIAFYRDRLGLAPAFDFINDKGERFGIYLHCGERTFIELFKGEVSNFAAGKSYSHFCLEVEDVAQAVAQLRAGGLEVSDAVLGEDHSWQAWLKDPDGNHIELHGYTPKSKQGPFLK